MRAIATTLFMLFMLQATLFSGEKMSIYDYKVEDIDGNVVNMNKYKGKVLLIVNVASECGFTPQYAGLEKLYEKYKDQGFMVLGFPCNQFRHQEPKTNQEIKFFCHGTYHVSFDMFSKVDVNGKGASPLYKFLKEQQGGFLSDDIKWNFTKFLVDREGNVVDRYAPVTKPESIESDLLHLLRDKKR